MEDYSQYGEQKFLINYFEDQPNGVLVDIGAADGINNSNTRHLLLTGWSGVLIEPNKKNYNKLLNLYKDNSNVKSFNFGCSNKSVDKAKFFIDKNDDYEQISTFNEETQVWCKEYFKCDFVEDEVDLVKTSELFINNNLDHIDFISIDAEGYDSLIIDGIDFNQVNIELFCLENVNSECEKKLIDNGYKLIHETAGNKFYKKSK